MNCYFHTVEICCMLFGYVGVEGSRACCQLDPVFLTLLIVTHPVRLPMSDYLYAGETPMIYYVHPGEIAEDY